MKVPLSLLLSAVGGYVDTIGFLALQGLFTAHVTGNFVTVGAALTQGSSGVLAKLLALPVFCLAVIATQLASHWLTQRRRPVLRWLLWVQFLLLTVGAALAIQFHPFAIGDTPSAILTGMVMVAAMAVQNSAHRLHLASSPPSTLMTGTTTQIMLDVANLIYGSTERPAVWARASRLALAVAAFAGGCALGALLFVVAGPWAFVLPPLLILFGACAGEAGLPKAA